MAPTFRLPYRGKAALWLPNLGLAPLCSWAPPRLVRGAITVPENLAWPPWLASCPGQAPDFHRRAPPGFPRDSETAAVALAEGAKFLVNKMATRAKVAKICCRSDCAEHFRARYMPYELLVGYFADINTAVMRFLGGGHGKPAAGGHFNWLGSGAKDY